MTQSWDTWSLFDALCETDEVATGNLTVEMVDGIDPVIQVTVADVLEFPSFVTVSGEQVLVMTTLWDVNEVPPEARSDLNETMLRANTVVPLSDFAIVGNSYVLFGSLSVDSSLNDVMTEIFTLAENVVDAVEDFATQLNS